MFIACQELIQDEGCRSSETDSHSGELPFALARARQIWGKTNTLARLGKFSNWPERGILSLKTRTTRLSDNSHRRSRRASASLA
ncbi:hypothetical protein DEO72_LG7g1280 [Vigna unguiculata]|uniref:Uncharacterized protein n=1 Tax=Vigna unguiculata TaxID=3917 RepID=A0A4D6MGS6_VIGUN|nr:hypothetical protein DEO72_LG7g1280 [Vigna unguiculata]